jgi:hypothetical protein
VPPGDVHVLSHHPNQGNWRDRIAEPRQRMGLVRDGISRIYPKEKPDPVEKHLVHSGNHGIGVSDAFMRAQSLWDGT